MRGVHKQHNTNNRLKSITITKYNAHLCCIKKEIEHHFTSCCKVCTGQIICTGPLHWLCILPFRFIFWIFLQFFAELAGVCTTPHFTLQTNELDCIFEYLWRPPDAWSIWFKSRRAQLDLSCDRVTAHSGVSPRLRRYRSINRLITALNLLGSEREGKKTCNHMQTFRFIYLNMLCLLLNDIYVNN